MSKLFTTVNYIALIMVISALAGHDDIIRDEIVVCKY